MSVITFNPSIMELKTDVYRNAYGTGKNLNIVDGHNILTLHDSGNTTRQFSGNNNSIIITSPNKTVVTYPFIGGTLKLEQIGTYRIVYDFIIASVLSIPTVGVEVWENHYSITYYVATIENKKPLKKWTMTEVINRTLELCEPLRRSEYPRFRLQGMNLDGTMQAGSQAELFDKINAPQFSFTKQTLRECLQEAGKILHGEPRLKVVKGASGYRYVNTGTFNNGAMYIGSNNGGGEYANYAAIYVLINGSYVPAHIECEGINADDEYSLQITDSTFNGVAQIFELVDELNEEYYYEVSFDMYASQEGSNLMFMPYTSKGCEHIINNYTAWLDSNAQHLVNQLDKYGGVIVEPYSGGAKTMRCETQYVRIEEGNMVIATQYPIYTVDKLEYVYVDGSGAIQSVDITAWLFEYSIYSSQLSSYSEVYPYSKAYAIYFKQGENNISGLNFKVDAAAFQAFKNYSIVNILRQAIAHDYSVSNYPTMSFRVTYTPIYDIRVAQSKAFVKGFEKPVALIFNQSANIIESRYYGENLKGTVARLGNVDISLTYTLKSMSQVPRAGMLFDKDYYISSVAVELMPTYIRATVGLSRDFNRISGYIGVSSEKRYYEISERQAVERNVLYREYIVVGDSCNGSDTRMNYALLCGIADIFTQSGSYSPLTSVTCWGESYKGVDMPKITLPVISSAFGNSISFSWKYADNYSAGSRSEYTQNALEGNVSGYFQNDTPYTDYYGRMYYYNFIIQSEGNQPTSSTLTNIGLNLPSGNESIDYGTTYVSTGDDPYTIRKDNREALQINYQIDFVTNSDIIIGSALSAYSPLVRGSDSSIMARLYVLPTEINKFTDHIEAWEDIKLSSLPYEELSVSVGNLSFSLTTVSGTYPASGKSWVIVTAQTDLEAEEVENEQGREFEQVSFKGGDLLIGRNITVTKGEQMPRVYFTKKKDIYDRTIWKENL